mmetsp:Transcript_4294/g.8337  ORF Transcript_4294/g.8337 Transcript_4294/m.8337 type:complete len:89 (-) Transcript_4294:290-556(-)|eukprot:CAMPEP_0113307642 /NCGR_PEP_ID=MMETSP0010_2-20120614/6408_1 /TAXON_ID=216773 ORGANISM="Corethron hystrix, Strain 308" /NCGR_SAMPLE_ID=MMETSP0010_2 /ASSEMBLY_ACC=CAM_ASM_000155 /LENGTH=88 /DNA_ID=CAMNT_0000162543 /DNA_START=88 /DNA_END=354 /DNA_ORIENTATION=+ /assembly_acc=CAM_ASM_000155
MKFSVLSTILAVAPLASVEAFAPAPFGVIARSMTAQSSSATAIFSDKKDEEDSGGLDLDLGEMFDMFDAADKGVDFDKAVDKIKGDKK